MKFNLKINIEWVVITQMDRLKSDIIVILPKPVYGGEEIVDWELPDVSDMIGVSIILSPEVLIKEILQLITRDNVIGGVLPLDKYFTDERESKIFVYIIIRYNVDDLWHYEEDIILKKGHTIFQLDKLEPSDNSELGTIGVRMLEDSLKFNETLKKQFEIS